MIVCPRFATCLSNAHNLHFMQTEPVNERLSAMRKGGAILSVSAFVQTFVALQERRRLQKSLRNLNDDLLDDIGMCRADIEAMSLQPSW